MTNPKGLSARPLAAAVCFLALSSVIPSQAMDDCAPLIS